MNAAIENRMKMLAQQVAAQVAVTRLAIVVSYDPATYSVKVVLQPEGGDTSGWLPLAALQAGNGFGVYAPPALGDMVVVVFDQGDLNAGIVLGSLFSDEDRPAPVPSGEILLKHKSGSLLRFHDNGDVTLTAAGTLTSSAEQWNHTGPLRVTGPLHATQDITSDADIGDQGGTKSMAAMREAHNGHSHPPDTTDLPDLEM